jgi:cobalt-zinc-cadmium efflux system protein
VPRLVHPERPNLNGMVGFALLGVAVNAYAAWRLQRGKTMNERVVSWHMIEDMLGWASVLIGAVVMMVVDLPIIDPILSIGFALFIFWGVLRSLRGTLRLFLQGSPEDIDLAERRTC